MAYYSIGSPATLRGLGQGLPKKPAYCRRWPDDTMDASIKASLSSQLEVHDLRSDSSEDDANQVEAQNEG
jgi:hypothetical protein